MQQAIAAERHRHQNELESLRQAAGASTERERTMAVEKALSVAQRQAQERRVATKPAVVEGLRDTFLPDEAAGGHATRVAARVMG